jgi:lambda family phage tail tape measure protein
MFEGVVKITAKTSGGNAIRELGGDIAVVGKRADAVNMNMGSLSKGIKALGAAAGGVTLANMILEMSRATIQIDAYRAQLGIGFGTAAANMELKALRATMNELGISQEENLGMAVRYTTALKLSGKSAGEANTIFKDTSKIILSNKLNAEDASRVFKAMMQTASKGKLMSEELTGQLGDTLAGYMQQVAGAMGISSGQLMENMKAGKVSAEEYFEAVKKVADGIDDSKLNSAARSLANVKNAFFDLKTSAITAETIKTALDALTAGMKFVTDNGRTMINIVKMAATVTIGLMVARAAAAAMILLGGAFAEVSFFATAYGVRATAASYASIGLATAARGAGVALNLMGGWIGVAVIALGALAYSLFTATTRHKALDAAADAVSKSQSSLAGVIDLTTGRINTQNEALLRLARTQAQAALVKARDAETEARGNTERQLSRAMVGQTDWFGARGIGMQNWTPAQQALAGLRDSMKRGDTATADVSKRLDALRIQFPQLVPAIDQMTKQIEGLTKAEIELKDARVQSAMLTVGVDRMSAADKAYAVARGMMGGDAGSPAPASAPSSSTPAAAKADPWQDRMEALKGQAAQLAAQAGAFDTFGAGVQHAEEALARFETSNAQYGKFFNETAARKAELIEAAKAVDTLKASVEASTAAAALASDQAKDRAQLEFAIKYATEYGEASGRAREALVRFRIEYGDLMGASQDVKDRFLKEAKNLDALAKSAKDAAENFKALEAIRKMAGDFADQLDSAKLEARRASMSEAEYERLKSELDLKRQIREATIGYTAERAAEYAAEAKAGWEAVQVQEALNRAKANTPQGGMATALKSYGEELAKSGEHWSAVWKKGLTGVEDALTNFVMTGKLSFRELALSIVADLARIAIQQAIMVPITMFLRSMGVPAFAKGSTFGGTGEVKAFAKGEGFGASSPADKPTPFANGSGFTNSIVKTPTLFNFMRGQKKKLGLMGEAGAEAVMPLKSAGGGLGVSAYGASGETTVPLKRGPGGRLGIDRDQLEASRAVFSGKPTPSLDMFARGDQFGAAPPAPAGRRPPMVSSGAPSVASGNTTVSIEVNIDQSGGAETSTKASAQEANALGKAISSAVQAEIIKQKRPGGLLAA